jgi:hypothetical protein
MNYQFLDCPAVEQKVDLHLCHLQAPNSIRCLCWNFL